MKTKLFIITLIIIAFAFFGYSFGKVFASSNGQNNYPIFSRIARILNPQTNIQPQTPLRFIIPKISVNAYVEQVGETSDGAMDVPQSEDDVGWWAKGAKPGENGKAVIDGHIDRRSGGPAVFYDLKNLNPGDEIEIIDTDQRHFIFTVEDKKEFNVNEFPIDQIFGNSDQRLLNLITCTGFFNQKEKNYTKRLVVFTKFQRSFK